MTEDKAQGAAREDPLNRPEVRWGLGCLLGSTALAGLVIIALILAFALSPPIWLQIVMGIGLVAGGAAMAWLVATALARSKEAERELEKPRAVETPDSEKLGP